MHTPDNIIGEHSSPPAIAPPITPQRAATPIAPNTVKVTPISIFPCMIASIPKIRDNAVAASAPIKAHNACSRGLQGPVAPATDLGRHHVYAIPTNQHMTK